MLANAEKEYPKIKDSLEIYRLCEVEPKASCEYEREKARRDNAAGQLL
jgi:hypothetical protein